MWQLIGQLLSSITAKFDIAQINHWLIIELFILQNLLCKPQIQTCLIFGDKLLSFTLTEKWVTGLRSIGAWVLQAYMFCHQIFGSNCCCKSDSIYVSYPVMPKMRFCHLVWDEVCGLLWIPAPVLWDNSFKLDVPSPNCSHHLDLLLYYWASVRGCHNQWALLLLADFPPTAEHPMWKTTQWLCNNTCVVEILQSVGQPVV